MSVETINASTAESLGTALGAIGSTNTKGGWVQLIASTAAEYKAILVGVIAGGADGEVLFDLATGAEASETAFISDLNYSRVGGTKMVTEYYYIPVTIASGSRIAARYQSTSGTLDLRLIAYGLTQDNVPLNDMTSAVTYGADTSDSGGTVVDPGGTAHTKGAWAVLSASTSADIKWLSLVIGRKANSAQGDHGWLIDIGTGAESSESAIVSNINVYVASTSDIAGPQHIGPFPVEISSGTRLVARAQCGSNDATDRLIDVEVIGYNGTASGGSGGGGFSAWMG